MSKDTGWLVPLEQSCKAGGHWHIEGYCVLRMGRTWSTKLAGCQAEGTDDPNEPTSYTPSLNGARELIRGALYTQRPES